MKKKPSEEVIRFPAPAKTHNKRDMVAERKKRQSLYEKHGHMIGCKSEDIPDEHRARVGGLRCFKQVYPRDENGNKMYTAPRQRCGNVCAKGSLYCLRHGGANSRALTTGTFAAMDHYRGAFSHRLGDMLEVFMNDPSISDHRRELATLRLILIAYIKKFAKNKPIASPKRLVGIMQDVLEASHLGNKEKYEAIRDIIYNEMSLTNGDVIDRVSRLVENIGKSIDRIVRNERKSGYYMTPEGFKIFLRAIQEIINKNITDDGIRKVIREELLSAGVKNQAEFNKDPVTIDVRDESNT